MGQQDHKIEVKLSLSEIQSARDRRFHWSYNFIAALEQITPDSLFWWCEAWFWSPSKIWCPICRSVAIVNTSFRPVSDLYPLQCIIYTYIDNLPIVSPIIRLFWPQNWPCHGWKWYPAICGICKSRWSGHEIHALSVSCYEQSCVKMVSLFLLLVSPNWAHKAQQ